MQQKVVLQATPLNAPVQKRPLLPAAHDHRVACLSEACHSGTVGAAGFTVYSALGTHHLQVVELGAGDVAVMQEVGVGLTHSVEDARPTLCQPGGAVELQGHMPLILPCTVSWLDALGCRGWHAQG